MRMLFFAGFLAIATPALADTTFSSGSMFYNGVVSVITICRIYNSGSKPVQITSVGMIPYLTGGTGPADSGDCFPVLDSGTIAPSLEGCTFLPLAPNASCYFTGSNASVYGGGVAMR